MLRHYINIQHWLDNDPVSDWQARTQRDREIHLSLVSDSQRPPLEHILNWWQQINKKYDVEDVGQHVVALLKWSSVLTAFIGLLLGVSTALAVLRYDGSEPINILLGLSVLVLAPLVLLVASLFLPWVNPNGILGRLNLGAMIQSVIKSRFLALEHAPNLSMFGLDKFLRWHLMGCSQIFGFTFALAALGILLLKVTLTDLAFAWGTTLSIESGLIYEIVSLVSSPWAAWFPAAAPDEALVAASKFYRLGDKPDNVTAVALTGWWRFLAVSLLFYGVLLRAALFVFTRFKAQTSLQKIFLGQPQSIALLGRLTSATITTSERTNATEPDELLNDNPNNSTQSLDVIACAFTWHGAPSSTGESQKISSLSVFDINEEADLLAQKNHIQSFAGSAQPVLIVCKGWEPPLLEFHDFLTALRGLLGAGTAIVVRPVDEQGADSSQEDKNVWRSSISTLNDANLYVQ